jgi:hypothetical protein
MEAQNQEAEALVGLTAIGTYAHVTREAICQAIKRGILKAEKVNGAWITTKSNVDHYIVNKYNREEKAKSKEGRKIFDIGSGIMSVKASAKYLSEELGRKVSMQRVYYMIARGYLVAYKQGSSWVVMEKDLRDIVRIEQEAEMAVLQK